MQQFLRRDTSFLDQCDVLLGNAIRRANRMVHRFDPGLLLPAATLMAPMIPVTRLTPETSSSTVTPASWRSAEPAPNTDDKVSYFH